MHNHAPRNKHCFSIGAILHTIVLTIFLLITKGAIGGEDRLYWLIFRALDFPLAILSDFLIRRGFTDIFGAYWFHFFHGVAGALWWGLCFKLICRFKNNLNITSAKRRRTLD